MGLLDAASGLAAASPWGAAASALGGALAGGSSSSSQGPVVAGPVSVNVAGFGSKSNSTASADARVPAGAVLDGVGGSVPGVGGLPSWALPAAGALALVLVVAAMLKHKGH